MNQFKLQGINHLALVCRDMARNLSPRFISLIPMEFCWNLPQKHGN
ncbi:hypothetical protein M595_1037 [Lyngbya aestuarii BL J]|uniref:Uncharacterized protein n=1 Tax=Lyngbya aestuarii BL J TaxID=1348334 RepID=U7QM22_9CYAN|nr:hypothetical protein [Lyngbya aestuarii]ERT09014.1 hypothetical protein M595_1037 [Lyngbya aestuarii BL J]